ncbi:hypothetical protein HYU23_03270 [Candidatus Woesearchaeota archaeon]|nr:hypothetical protein [Candidatus Woesearchaeota archaeon]
MNEREIRGSYKELVDFISRLDSSYNHLELILIDLENQERIDGAETPVPYAKVIENYTLSSYSISDRDPIARTEVQVFDGSYPLGKPWKPLEIKIKVDGHSYVRDTSLWPKYFEMIKARLVDLIEKGYVVGSFEVMKNQKDDFPGDIDAEEVVKGYPKRE